MTFEAEPPLLLVKPPQALNSKTQISTTGTNQSACRILGIITQFLPQTCQASRACTVSSHSRACPFVNLGQPWRSPCPLRECLWGHALHSYPTLRSPCYPLP